VQYKFKCAAATLGEKVVSAAHSNGNSFRKIKINLLMFTKFKEICKIEGCNMDSFQVI